MGLGSSESTPGSRFFHAILVAARRIEAADLEGNFSCPTVSLDRR
jgi:hypothetical protein